MNVFDTQYKRLTHFAFVPSSVLKYSGTQMNTDELFNYLCFSYEHNLEKDLVVIKDNYALFNTGLRNIKGEDIFAYFELNKTDKQKWRLMQLATIEYLKSSIDFSCKFIASAVTFDDYSIGLFEFSFAHDDKFKNIANMYFGGDLYKAKDYVGEVFANANKLGYVMVEDNQCIFNIGLLDKDEYI